MHLLKLILKASGKRGVPQGGVLVITTTYELLKDKYLFEERGVIEVKGKGKMKIYLLTGRKTS